MPTSLLPAWAAAFSCLEISTDVLCRKGHTGPLCAVCVSGYAKTGDGLCAECPPERAELNVAVAPSRTFGLIVVVVVMILWQTETHTSLSMRSFNIMKITSSMLQVYTVCSGFDVKWPSLLVTVFEKSVS